MPPACWHKDNFPWFLLKEEDKQTVGSLKFLCSGRGERRERRVECGEGEEEEAIHLYTFDRLHTLSDMGFVFHKPSHSLWSNIIAGHSRRLHAWWIEGPPLLALG
jgi:hypothetical protein